MAIKHEINYRSDGFMQFVTFFDLLTDTCMLNCRLNDKKTTSDKSCVNILTGGKLNL